MRVGTQKENALSLWDISIGHHSPWRIKVNRYCMEPVFSTRKFIVPLSNYFFFFQLENNCVIQYCDGFCPTSTWISHRHIYGPPSWTSLPSPSPPHPSRVSWSTSFGFPASYSKFPLAISFTSGNIYVSMLLSQIIPPSPSPVWPKIMSASLFLPCKLVH